MPAHAVNPEPAILNGATQRDVRLDFFRGIAMFIILIAHTPGNWLTLWIPARWGFSDATEIFVFCSGMASAIAFGRTFDRAGWWLGTARVGFRIWQVYWAHIGLFLATVALVIAITDAGIGTRNYWGQLNLWPLFVESERWSNPKVWMSFMTLSYVPNYFDILPMYLVVLAMMPILLFLARIHRAFVFGTVLVMWGLAQEPVSQALGLPVVNFVAEPWFRDDGSQRYWFFNPFGWQLIFFTGFAFMRGWLSAPPRNWLLMLLAIAVIVGNVFFSNVGIREFGFDWARDWRASNQVWITKTNFGLLRYVHFLALAYLAWLIVGEKGRNIQPLGQNIGARLWRLKLSVILKVGQQSLAVFVFSMFFARLMGVALDIVGRSHASMLLVNAIGAVALIVVAFIAAWFKSQPWRMRGATHVST